MITRGWTILGFALASWLVAFALIVGLGLFLAVCAAVAQAVIQ